MWDYFCFLIFVHLFYFLDSTYNFESTVFVFLWLILQACSDAQLCLTPCDPMDCSPLVSPVHGSFQVRMLEWVAISYSRGSSWSRNRTSISCISCTGRQTLFHCATRGAWCILLSTAPSRSIRAATNGKISIFYGWVMFHCMCILHLLYRFIF